MLLLLFWNNPVPLLLILLLNKPAVLLLYENKPVPWLLKLLLLLFGVPNKALFPLLLLLLNNDVPWLLLLPNNPFPELLLLFALNNPPKLILLLLLLLNKDVPWLLLLLFPNNKFPLFNWTLLKTGWGGIAPVLKKE